MPHAVCSNCLRWIYRAAGARTSFLRGEWRWDLLLASFSGAWVCKHKVKDIRVLIQYTRRIPGRSLAAWHRLQKFTGSVPQPPAQHPARKDACETLLLVLPRLRPRMPWAPPQTSPRTARRMPLQVLPRGGFPGHLLRTTPRMPPRTPPQPSGNST